jgi:pimeloyl-ACP methyl ester carboxylesterase
MIRSKTSIRSHAGTAAVHLRRLYSDCRFGQLHVRSAFSSSGGFDERRTLICLHDAGGSSRTFRALLAEFGRDRSAYAPDLPGSGESETRGEPQSIADYAAAVADFVDGLRLREFDLVGLRVGAQIALEVALAMPARVRHLVLAGVPCLSADERRQRAVGAAIAPPREDGAHLADAWRRLRAQLGTGLTLDDLQHEFAQRLQNAHGGAALAGAGLAHATAERLMLIQQPTLVLRTAADPADSTQRAHALIPSARRMDLVDGPLPFATVDAAFALDLRAFLDG